MEIKPIAHIYTDFKEKFGIPRQSGRVAELFGKIVFEPFYRNPDAIRGLDEFSHIWLIFGFSESDKEEVSLTVRPPRLGGNERIGVFASRAPFRPNSLGLSCVKLEKIDAEKNEILVSGVDMLDNTPIYDIKPYIPYCDSKPDAQGGYAEKNKDYSLKAVFPERLLNIIPKDKQNALIKCLEEDPRPSYHEDGRCYSMRFSEFDIRFCVESGFVKVFDVCKITQ